MTAKRAILLTGATGFLGSRLLAALLAADYAVCVLKRTTSNLSRIEKYLSEVTLIDCDQSDYLSKLNKSKINVIIHTATNYGRSHESISSISKTNTNFPLALLEWAVHKQIQGFINTDTVLPADMNPYAISKAQFLAWGNYFAREKNFTFVNVKLEYMFGPGDDKSKFTAHIIESCKHHVSEIKLTSGEQQRDFIYIEDVLSAYQVLLTHLQADKGFSEYHLGSGKTVSIREFAEMVCRLSKSKSKLLFGVLPYRNNEIMHSLADINALKAMGWQPEYTLEQGILKSLNEAI